MFSKSKYAKAIGLGALAVFAVAGTAAYATHSWGNYHWARTANPFTLNLGDNVATAWDSYLATASGDWSASSVLDTTIVAGKSPKCAFGVSGRVEVCNRKYGFNGWLGLAQIWVSQDHIIAGLAKMNDTYFNTKTYNTPAWRQFVVCQEVAHTFGLDHQDEIFNNANLGSCMDYTNNPSGPPSNEHPNTHDFEQLEAIYTHFDSVTTVGQTATSQRNHASHEDASQWGKSLKKDGNGRTSLYERDLGNGKKLFTFVIWAD